MGLPTKVSDHIRSNVWGIAAMFVALRVAPTRSTVHYPARTRSGRPTSSTARSRTRTSERGRSRTPTSHGFGSGSSDEPGGSCRTTLDGAYSSNYIGLYAPGMSFSDLGGIPVVDVLTLDAGDHTIGLRCAESPPDFVDLEIREIRIAAVELGMDRPLGSDAPRCYSSSGGQRSAVSSRRSPMSMS
jgi:hypothetical protein